MAVTKKKAKPVEDSGDPVADKQKALSTALGQIEKNYGKGAIMKLGEGLDVDVDAISTGSISLDLALGVGGVPRGRIVEIYGPESSGKTTVALHIIAEAQKAGGEAAFIDAEHALDPRYAKKLGVNINNLLVSQPDCGEDGAVSLPRYAEGELGLMQHMGAVVYELADRSYDFETLKIKKSGRNRATVSIQTTDAQGGSATVELIVVRTLDEEGVEHYRLDSPTY